MVVHSRRWRATARCVLFVVLLWCPMMCLAQGSTLRDIAALFELLPLNPREVKAQLSVVSADELSAVDDTTRFDYYYLLIAADEKLGIHSAAKRDNLLTAQRLCANLYGILSSVYLELLWVLGQEELALGDSLSALHLYRDGCIMSKGIYSAETMSSSDRDNYAAMEDYVLAWYSDSSRRAQVITSFLSPPVPFVADLLEYPNEDEAFVLALNSDATLLAAYQEGALHEAAGELEESIALYLDVLARKDLDVVTRSSFNLLLCKDYIDVGSDKAAETVCFENIANIERAGLTAAGVYRKTLSMLGNLYNGVHNYADAQEYCSRAKCSFEEQGDIGPGYILCLARCATAALRLHNYSLALFLTDTALHLESSLSQVFDMSRFGYRPTLLNNASVIYAALGYTPDAMCLVNAAVAAAEEQGANPCRYLFNLGNAFAAEGRYDDALSLFRRAYTLAQTADEKIVIGMHVTSFSYVAEHSIPSEVAVEVSTLLRENITTTFMFLSTTQRENLWKYYEQYLPALNFYLYATHDDEAMGCIYDNILYEKGLLLRTANAIKEAIITSGNEDYISSYEEMLRLRQQALHENDAEKSEQYTSAANRLDKFLTTNISEYAAFNNDNTIGWREVRAHLTEKDIAIEFYNIPLYTLRDTPQSSTAETRFCAVVLRNDYSVPQIIPLCTASALAKAQNELCDIDSLYPLVWQPLEEVLQGVETIYFSADGEIHKTAVEYALHPDGRRMNDAYTIYRLSSTRVLAESPSPVLAPHAVLYGGLHYDLPREALIAQSRSVNVPPSQGVRSGDLSSLRYDVSYLPGSKEEVEKIGETFAATHHPCLTLTGDEGTEETLRALSKDITILHLATHGFFWTEDDAARHSAVSFLRSSAGQEQREQALSRSGLLFSGANVALRGEDLPEDVDDGVVTAQELANMDLSNIHLAVLSACQSALGETTGEGVFGLQRGFKLAGVQTLMMSLWKVDDRATQILMTAFYQHLLAGVPAPAALTYAQQHLRSHPTYADPYYWAAFILLDAVD